MFLCRIRRCIAFSSLYDAIVPNMIRGPATTIAQMSSLAVCAVDISLRGDINVSVDEAGVVVVAFAEVHEIYWG